MAEVTWIKGTIDTQQSGAYYVAKKAMIDMVDTVTGEAVYRVGDVVIDIEFYCAGYRVWKHLSKDNPFWEVVCWANILKPDIPDGVRDRLVEYFGEKVQWQNGDTCPNFLAGGGGENNADA